MGNYVERLYFLLGIEAKVLKALELLGKIKFWFDGFLIYFNSL